MPYARHLSKNIFKTLLLTNQRVYKLIWGWQDYDELLTNQKVNDDSERMKQACTIVHSKTRHSWFHCLIGYNSLQNGTIIKSMGSLKKFRKFSIWWALRFSILDKRKLRKVGLKIFTWSKKVWLFAQITPFLIFWAEWASLTTVFSGIFWWKSEVFLFIGKEISWIFKNSPYLCL